MPFDLMLSENGDLVFSASRDLQGVGGTAQVEQSIRTRLKIPRGSWDYDEDGTLGSMLHSLSGAHPLEVESRAQVFVREALRGLDDAAVDDVQVEIAQSVLNVAVYYHLTGEGSDLDATEAGNLTFTIPLGG